MIHAVVRSHKRLVLKNTGIQLPFLRIQVLVIGKTLLTLEKYLFAYFKTTVQII